MCLCQVRVKALDALGAARVLDKGLAACRALEAGMHPRGPQTEKPLQSVKPCGLQ